MEGIDGRKVPHLAAADDVSVMQAESAGFSDPPLGCDPESQHLGTKPLPVFARRVIYLLRRGDKPQLADLGAIGFQHQGLKSFSRQMRLCPPDVILARTQHLPKMYDIRKRSVFLDDPDRRLELSRRFRQFNDNSNSLLLF